MTHHSNSLAAYLALDIGEREAAVLKVYNESMAPLTDREVMRRLGFTDPNAVRPRTTDLVQAGLLEECGDTIDKQTGKTVRLCRPAGRTLTIKPVDPAKQRRREICELIAKMEDQGATKRELCRVFPALSPQAVGEAVDQCWAHACLDRHTRAELRQGEPVFHITKHGLEKLGKDPARHWHVDAPQGVRS